jgi:hypothetical protein
MDLHRYRAVRRKVRSKPEAERTFELVRIIKAGDDANRAAYKSLKTSGLDQEAAETILRASQFRRQSRGVHPR